VEDQRRLRLLAQLQAQCGIITREQALETGVSERGIDRRLRSGRWQRLGHGVYATFTGVLPREAKLWAAVLQAGPGAALSHRTAAEFHGLVDKPVNMIHVSVPAERRPARQGIRGVVVHRRRGLTLEWLPPWQLPRTSVEDTVLDLIGAARNFDDAYGWISAAVGRRLTTPDLLAKALAGRSRMRWRAWVAGALQDAGDGVHSPLERGYVYGVERAHGLPAARRQARRRHGSGNRYLDNLYEDYDLCVEADGEAAHPAEGRWQDTRRDNENLRLGTQTLRYGWLDVTAHRCRTASQVAAVLRRRGWTGTLRRCGPACTAVAAGQVAAGQVAAGPRAQGRPRAQGKEQGAAS